MPHPHRAMDGSTEPKSLRALDPDPEHPEFRAQYRKQLRQRYVRVRTRVGRRLPAVRKSFAKTPWGWVETHPHAHARTETYAHARAHSTRTRTRTRTRTHAHAHACTRTHAHTHTHHRLAAGTPRIDVTVDARASTQGKPDSCTHTCIKGHALIPRRHELIPHLSMTLTYCSCLQL
jgi:hypothetical protein